MYYKIIYNTIIFGLFLFSCAAQKANIESGTLKGVIGIYEGNCMPAPNVEPCQSSPISTTVFITQPSEKFDIELLIDSMKTNKSGEYLINLPAGSYSIFLRDSNKIICDGFKCEKECFCTPFEISADSTTIINANIDHATW